MPTKFAWVRFAPVKSDSANEYGPEVTRVRFAEINFDAESSVGEVCVAEVRPARRSRLQDGDERIPAPVEGFPPDWAIARSLQAVDPGGQSAAGVVVALWRSGSLG